MMMASDGGDTHLSMSSYSDDLSAVETLTREGSELMSQKRLRHSIKKYTKAYELAESLNDKVALQSCACNLGAALIAKGDAEEAIRYLKNALPQKHSKNGKKSKNKSILADVHYNLGLGYSVLENLSQSIRHLNYAIELFIACKDMRGFAEGYHQLGEQYLRKQQLQTAAKCFEESSRAFEEVGDLFAQTKMLLKLGESLVIHQREEAGLQVAKVCDAVCEKLHVNAEYASSSDIGKKARCFHDLGILYSKLNAHESATRWYEAALINMRSSNIPSAGIHEARILENYGLTCNIIQQYSRAVQLHKEAASLHGELGNSSERGWCFYHLAEAYRNLGQHSDAERTYHVASQIFEDSGQVQWQWKVMIGLGDLSYDRRNLDGAIRHYKDALRQLHKNRSEETMSLENHVMEKLVMALQVQRAGMVRMASYKSRKPVIINPELEKMVLESMSSSLQQSMTFEGQDVPNLPTLDAKDLIHSSDSESSFFSSQQNMRPLTYGKVIPRPSPILESPKKMSSIAVHKSVNGNHLVAPRSPGTTRRRKHVGRRRADSYGVPVTSGVDSYSSATDLSLIDSQTAKELREANAKVAQEEAAKQQKKKKGLKKLAKQAKAKIKGRRPKSENQERPENLIDGLEYTSDHEKSSTPVPSDTIEIVDETGSSLPNTSAAEYTTLEYQTSSLGGVSSEDEDVFLTQSQDGRQEEEDGSESEQSISGSDSEVLSSSEDEWNEEDVSVTESSDEAGNSSAESESDENLNATYCKPLEDEPLYSTIRSQNMIDPSHEDTLYETLNSTRSSYKLPGTMPTRKPDTPPMAPPTPPTSERPKRSVRRKGSDSDESSSSTPNEREQYPPSPIMTQYSVAHR
ncbi:uncharacterized protein [Amphiura filiformis]